LAKGSVPHTDDLGGGWQRWWEFHEKF
jgi:hypothetical protein